MSKKNVVYFLLFLFQLCKKYMRKPLVKLILYKETLCKILNKSVRSNFRYYVNCFKKHSFEKKKHFKSLGSPLPTETLGSFLLGGMLNIDSSTTMMNSLEVKRKFHHGSQPCTTWRQSNFFWMFSAFALLSAMFSSFLRPHVRRPHISVSAQFRRRRCSHSRQCSWWLLSPLCRHRWIQTASPTEAELSLSTRANGIKSP